jgi:hypothetical protein
VIAAYNETPMSMASEVANQLNAHVSTVGWWNDKGILKVYHISPRGDRRFQKEDIAGFLPQ